MMGRELPFTLNLANSIMGVSLLAMPFCFMRCGILLGTILLLLSTYLTTVTCELLVKAGIASKRRSYEFLAYDLFGACGKLLVEIGITGVQLGVCIAFHVIIGDLGPSLISKWSGCENTQTLRLTIMTLSAFVVSLPLSLMRNLESITKLSVLSICFYIVVVISVFVTSWNNLVNGSWTHKVDFWNTANIFQCLPIFAMAFGCQTQMFILYEALPEPSLSVLNRITSNGVNLCMIVYLVVRLYIACCLHFTSEGEKKNVFEIEGFFGYIAFYDKDIAGDILLNFQPSFGADLLKFGFVISVALSFPLMVFPCRQSLNTLLFSTSQSLQRHAGFTGTAPMPTYKFNGLTAAIILGTLMIGIYFPNVEFVIGLNGSTMGCLISFIFPAIMFLKVSSSQSGGKMKARVVLVVGILTLLLSTYSTIHNAPDSQQPGNLDDLVTPVLILDDHIGAHKAHKPLQPISEVDSKLKRNKEEKDKVPVVAEQQEDPLEVEQKEPKVGKVKRGKKKEGDGNQKEEEEDVGKNKIKAKAEERQEPPNPVPPETNEENAPSQTKAMKVKNVKGDNKLEEKTTKPFKAGKRRTKAMQEKDTKLKSTTPKLKVDDEKDENKEHIHSKDPVKDKEETHQEIKQLIHQLKQQQEIGEDLIQINKELIKEIKKKEPAEHEDDHASDVKDEQKREIPEQVVLQQNVQQQNVPQQNVPQQNVPQQNVPQQSVPQQNVLQQVVPQQVVPQQNLQQQNVPQQVVPQQNVQQQVVPQQVVPQQNVQQQVVPQQNVPQQNVQQQAVPQQNVQQQVAPQQVVPQQNVPQQVVPQQNVQQQNVPQQNVQQQVVPQQNVQQQVDPQQVVPQQNVPQQVVPQQNVQQQFVPQQNVPQQVVPQQNVQQQVVPQQNVQQQVDPQQVVPQQNVPQQVVPQQNVQQQVVPQQNVQQQFVQQQNVPQPNVPQPNVPQPNVPQPNVPQPNVPLQVIQQNVPQQNVPLQGGAPQQVVPLQASMPQLGGQPQFNQQAQIEPQKQQYVQGQQQPVQIQQQVDGEAAEKRKEHLAEQSQKQKEFIQHQENKLAQAESIHNQSLKDTGRLKRSLKDIIEKGASLDINGEKEANAVNTKLDVAIGEADHKVKGDVDGATKAGLGTEKHEHIDNKKTIKEAIETLGDGIIDKEAHKTNTGNELKHDRGEAGEKEFVHVTGDPAVNMDNKERAVNDISNIKHDDNPEAKHNLTTIKKLKHDREEV